MAVRGIRKMVPLLAAVVSVAAGMVVTAAPASANPNVFRCFYEGAPYKDGCDVSVTGIHSGSYLALHNQPNYSDGTIKSSPHLTNGYGVQINCWVYGAGDADGHGDHYWFWTGAWKNGSEKIYTGYINDWYVTSGSYAHWSKYLNHCSWA